MKSSSTPTFDYKLTAREINLINRLRNIDYGIIEVHVIEGKLVRTIQKKNELLEDKLIE